MYLTRSLEGAPSRVHSAALPWQCGDWCLTFSGTLLWVGKVTAATTYTRFSCYRFQRQEARGSQENKKVLLRYPSAFIMEGKTLLRKIPEAASYISLFKTMWPGHSSLPGKLGKETLTFSSFIVESRKGKTGLGIIVKEPTIAVCHKNSIRNTGDVKHPITGMAWAMTNQSRGWPWTAGSTVVGVACYIRVLIRYESPQTLAKF